MNFGSYFLPRLSWLHQNRQFWLPWANGILLSVELNYRGADWNDLLLKLLFQANPPGWGRGFIFTLYKSESIRVETENWGSQCLSKSAKSMQSTRTRKFWKCDKDFPMSLLISFHFSLNFRSQNWPTGPVTVGGENLLEKKLKDLKKENKSLRVKTNEKQQSLWFILLYCLCQVLRLIKCNHVV